MVVNLPLSLKFKLSLQRQISFLMLPILYPLILGWLILVQRYRIIELKAIRQQFKRIINNNQEPLIICANHLTYIDSLLLLVAFGSLGQYIINFRTLAWNMPKKHHVKENWFYPIISYLGKCILVDPAQEKTIGSPLEQAKYLLTKGEVLMIFPEGKRSHSGRIDQQSFTYGVGRLISEIPQAKVLCVYLRGKKQQSKSTFPAKGDEFYCKLKLITPIAASAGLRAMRELSNLIINDLVEMEQAYFLSHT